MYDDSAPPKAGKAALVQVMRLRDGKVAVDMAAVPDWAKPIVAKALQHFPKAPA